MLEMVKKHLDWNTSSCKAGRTAHAIRVDPDNLANLGFLFRCHHFNLAFLAAFRKAPTEAVANAKRYKGAWRS